MAAMMILSVGLSVLFGGILRSECAITARFSGGGGNSGGWCMVYGDVVKRNSREARFDRYELEGRVRTVCSSESRATDSRS